MTYKEQQVERGVLMQLAIVAHLAKDVHLLLPLQR
jgi:hypothetical protein